MMRACRYTPDEIQCIAEKQHDSMLTQLMKVWKDADIDGSGAPARTSTSLCRPLPWRMRAAAQGFGAASVAALFSFAVLWLARPTTMSVAGIMQVT